MKPFRHSLLSLLLPLLLAACAQQDDAAPAATAADATPAVEQTAAPAADAPASAEAPADDNADAAATDAPAPAQATTPQGPAPVEGTHYVVIENGQPFQPLNGQIEVVEVFGYTCGACASFEPVISAWKKRQPEDVRVTMLAAPFGSFWTPYAKAYYAAEALDLVDATHDAMFRAIHLERSLPVQGVSNDAIAAFYAQHGADARRFAQTMDSFAVSGQMRRAQQFIAAAGVDATPTMVVNGKYRVLSGQDYQDVLRIVDHLAARERAAGGNDTAQ